MIHEHSTNESFIKRSYSNILLTSEKSFGVDYLLDEHHDKSITHIKIPFKYFAHLGSKISS